MGFYEYPRKGHTAVKKKIVAIILAFTMALGMIPMTAVPALAEEPAGGSASGNIYYQYNTATQKFDQKNIPSGAQTLSSAGGNVSLSGSCYVVTGSVSVSENLTFTGDVLLILKGGCNLTVGKQIKVTDGHSLTICSDTLSTVEADMGKLNANWGGIVASGENGSITVNGGKITVTSNISAGIGCDSHETCGDITINGGRITATSNKGAAIGAGQYGFCGYITVNGGIIDAYSDKGTGIGSGYDGSSYFCKDITINGGSVKAGSGGNSPGIGAGCSSRGCGNITINGGTVEATSSTQTAAIGSGYQGTSCGDITINGGSVTAICLGSDTSAIGSGRGSSCGDITINGGVVLAEVDGQDCTGIGRTWDSSCGTLSINGGSVTAYNLYDGYGKHTALDAGDTVIGPFMKVKAGNTAEDASDKSKYSGERYACFRMEQQNYYEYDAANGCFDQKKSPELTGLLADSASDVVLSDPCYFVTDEVNVAGKLSFTGDVLLILDEGSVLNAGAGISVADGHTLTVCPSTLDEANIGKIVSEKGGIRVSGGASLAIHGGDIKAVGSDGSAGIGGGAGEAGGNIVIYGGKIYAEGDFLAAGIGGGNTMAGGNIDIYGGDIEAVGGDGDEESSGGAGIGSGGVLVWKWNDDYYWDDTELVIVNPGTAGTITVYGGTVSAQGGYESAGIGGGRGSDGGTVTVYDGSITATGGTYADGIGCGWYDFMDDSFSDTVPYPVSGGILHIYGEDVTSNGVKVIPEHLHRLVAFPVKEATCTEDGNSTAYYRCTGEKSCGKYYADGGAEEELTAEEVNGYVVSALGHSFTSGEYKDNGDGTHLQKCIRCDEYGGEQEHDPLSGVYVDNGNGTHSLKCSDCGAVISTTEHAFTSGVYKDNRDGTHLQKCAQCDAYGAAESHQVEKYVSDENATCTEDGTKSGKCEGCALTVTVTDPGSKKGHDFSSGYFFDNGDGTHSEKCIRCSEYGDAEDHTFSETSDGVCDCGAYEDHTHIDADGDNFCDSCELELYIIRRYDEADAEIIETYMAIPDTAVILTPDTETLAAGEVYVVEGPDDESEESEESKESIKIKLSGRLTVKGTAENPTVLILKDGCYLDAQYGIEAGKESFLFVCGQSGDSGYLYAESDDDDAAIGGGYYGDGGTVIVNGGTVIANDEDVADYGSDYGYGAGIGGGYEGNGGTLVVNDGTVIAYSGYNGAAIGGGYNGDGGEITITGGTVTVNGGTVEAYSGYYGAGIGGGYEGNGGTVTINDGTVTACSSDYGCGAGIGGGDYGDGGIITITGGTVIASGSTGIGGGDYGAGGTVTITGGIVEANGDYGAGIGSGYDCEEGSTSVEISGGEVYASTDDDSSSAIGAGCYAPVTDVSVRITGGTVTAQAIDSAAVGAEEIFIDPSLYLKAGSDAGSAEPVIVYDGESYLSVSTETVVFNTVSLTLDGALGVNFYVDVLDPDAVDENAYMEMAFEGGESIRVNLSADLYDEEKGKYRFTFSVNALQMAETITASFFSDDESVLTRSISVADYAEIIIGNSRNEKMVKLAQAILTYGYYAQLALQETHGFTLGDGGKYRAMDDPGEVPELAERCRNGGGTEEIICPYCTNGSTPGGRCSVCGGFGRYFADLHEYALRIGGANENITALSMSLALDERTDICIYVTTDTQPTVTGAEGIKVEKAGERYRITILNIAAHRLADTYSLDIDGLKVDVSALSYVSAVLSSAKRSMNYKCAAAALFEYYAAAMDYIGYISE